MQTPIQSLATATIPLKSSAECLTSWLVLHQVLTQLQTTRATQAALHLSLGQKLLATAQPLHYRRLYTKEISRRRQLFGVSNESFERTVNRGIVQQLPSKYFHQFSVEYQPRRQQEQFSGLRRTQY